MVLMVDLMLNCDEYEKQPKGSSMTMEIVAERELFKICYSKVVSG